MRNHEIRERHEKEESCGQSIADIARRSFTVTWDQNSLSFFTFASFVFFVVNNPGEGADRLVGGFADHSADRISCGIMLQVGGIGAE